MSELKTPDADETILFYCENKPVRFGDVLYHHDVFRTGGKISAMRRPDGEMARVRAIPSGAVPFVNINDLTWEESKESILKRAFEKEARKAGYMRPTSRDLHFWKLGVAYQQSQNKVLSTDNKNNQLSDQPSISVNGNVFLVDDDYLSGVRAKRDLADKDSNPHTEGSPEYDQWAAGFENESSGYHDQFDRLKYYYGPTEKDKDPGKMWCSSCGGEVLGFDEGNICYKCHLSDD